MRVLTVFAAALIALLSACGQGGAGFKADAGQLKGAWLAQGEPYMHLTLNDGGGLVYCKGEICALGKWKIAGDKLLLNYTEGEKSVELELTMRVLTNGVLECEYPQGKKVTLMKETNQ